MTGGGRRIPRPSGVHSHHSIAGAQDSGEGSPHSRTKSVGVVEQSQGAIPAPILQRDVDERIKRDKAAKARLDGALAIISGRSINDLSRLLSPLELPLAGQHGAERHDEVNGYSLSEPDYATLHEAREELRRFLGAHPELELEDKGASLALHYRNAPDKQPTIERQLDSLRERLGDALIMHGGKSVFELRTTSCNKGEAIHHFMQAAPFAQRTPVFLGDDLTDEDGFEAVNALGGYSIKVGQGETRARYRLDDTHAVEAWLKTCLEQWPSR